MNELREFARHSDELESLGVLALPISVDDQQHACDVWEKVADARYWFFAKSGANIVPRVS